MNVLFLTLLSFDSIKEHNIYTDLLREFVKNEHHVYAVSPVEKHQKQDTHLIKEENTTILRLQIGNIQKTNIIEKGISTVMIGPLFKNAMRKYFSNVKFDLVLYSTPPITLVSAIKYVKKRDGAKTYLLLKDIFPQNAVDIGMMNKVGVKGILYRYFRQKEKKLYAISDYIGCMSQANVDYVMKHNPEIKSETVEVCPNSIEVIDMRVETTTRDEIRQKYGIPIDKKVFIYGGNLGKPQGVSFLIRCLKSQIINLDVYFLVVGEGTEFCKLEKFFNEQSPKNMKLMKRLPKEDYDRLVAACDIGMIFLNHRFTIPNFPSRLLSYMQAGIPIFAVTDSNTDIGKVIMNGGFCWWCESNDMKMFNKKIKEICKSALGDMGEKAFLYLKENYSAMKSYEIIVNHFE